jgi:hypothetical protein
MTAAVPTTRRGIVSDNWPGLSDQDRLDFHREGYLRTGPLLSLGEVAELRAAFQDAWAAGEKLAPQVRCWMLTAAPFRAVLNSSRLRKLLRWVFCEQAQLLDCYPIYQPPAQHPQAGPAGQRDWHRDFTFVRDPDGTPLMVTVLVFIDDVQDEVGPTLVLPGTHRVPHQVITRHATAPRADELALPVQSGDGLLLNSSIVHSPGQNRSARPRRGIVMNFGYWWMKPWDMELPLPPEATDGITAESQCLLGLRSPADNLYLFAAI